MNCDECLGTGIDPDEQEITGNVLPCLRCDGKGYISANDDSPDEEDDDVDDEQDGPRCACGRESIAEGCEECGTPLCPMCYECGAGFCREHPSENYEPDY